MKQKGLILLGILAVIFLAFKGYDLSNTFNRRNELPQNLERNFINQAVQKFAGLWLREEIAQRPDKNIVISPVSMYWATAMLAQGSDAQAYNELSVILGTKENTPLPAFNQALQKSSALYSKYAQIANSIWGNKFKDSFVKAVRNNMDAEAKKLPSSVKPINDWVKNKTGGEISNIIPDVDLDEKKAFLINAIYFKADWTSPFKVEHTKKRNFETPTGVVPVDMMEKTQDIPYYEDNMMQAVILHYKDNRDWMTIYLPKKNIPWGEFIAHLTEQDFEFPFENENVSLRLPKFNTEYEPNDLIKTLHKWNVTSIFQIGHLENMGKNAVIEMILHKAKVKVDEVGTVAAAVTVYGEKDLAPEPEMTGPRIVWADHPFVFKIDDALFIGAVMNPNQ